MPGANDLAVVDHALAEWTASVQADIVHGAVEAVHVRDADVFVAAGEFFGLVWARQVGLAGQFDYGRHRFSVVRYRPGACPHTKLFWLQGLGDHHLALEVLNHVGIQADFGGLLRDRHGIDFVLQF